MEYSIIDHDDSDTELEKNEFKEWKEVMVKEMGKLFVHFKDTPSEVIEFDTFQDCGMIVDRVTSKSGKEYFVLVTIRSTCVTFLPVDDDVHCDYGTLDIDAKVLIRKNFANDVKFVRISNIHDYNKKRLDSESGFLVKYIYRYNNDGKKEAEYFFGRLNLCNLSADDLDSEYNSSKSSVLSDSSDSSVINSSNSDTSSDSDSDKSESEEEKEERPNNVADDLLEEEQEEEYDEEQEEENINILPNLFYKRLIVPQILMDCAHREDEFYARENIPFIWVPTIFVHNHILNEIGNMQDLLRWKIPRMTVCSMEEFTEVLYAGNVRGCFVDKDHIFLASAPHSLALYSGDARHPGPRIGHDICVDEKYFDDYLKLFIINHFFIEDDEEFNQQLVLNNPFLDAPSILLIPTENKEFESQLNPQFELRHFYQSVIKFCYIYDRHGVIKKNPLENVMYPIKVNRDFRDGKYLTVLEIYPVPERGFEARDIEDDITGNGFVVNDEIVYCDEHSYAPIYYSKEEFKLEFGTFGKITASYDYELQQYRLMSFEQSSKKRIVPKYSSDKKLCYTVNVKRKNCFYINDFFGIISIKPYRDVNNHTEKLHISYVGNEPKYQTPFAENEEYTNVFISMHDSDDGLP